MRVISIIVRLIALCDPALHKTTEEAAHPSLFNKRGVNLALLLLLSLAFFGLTFIPSAPFKTVRHNALDRNA